jgi:CheY-like chemotaxis protein/HPt (histidine-containing phosphotransfer) domain-containing protein
VNVLGISVDITHIKKHSEELVKAKKAKEQFMANMSHEIRTPINGIVGMIKLLEATPTLPDQRKYIDAIKKSSETLQVLINDILDLSIIESGNIRLDYIGFRPNTLLSALIESFRYTAQEKGLQLTLNYDPFIADVLIGDPTRLNQILLNLIGNAMKFTKKGYVRVYVLKLNDDDETNHLQFIIEDSGIGIQKQNLTKIFESFEQGDENIARKYGGTGLGLAIVKQLIDLQNGTIQLKSSEGQGTTFTIDLTFEVGTEADLDRKKTPQEKQKEETREIDLSPYRLLLVEDNEVNLLYSKMVLEKWGVKIDTANNGLEALEMLKKNDYDLILMDVLMPTMNGFEATHFIRTNFKSPKSETKIIAITANAIKGDYEKCIEAGMDDYLSKPFKPDELKATITRQLGIQEESKPAKKVDPVNAEDKFTNLSYLKEISDNDPAFVTEMIRSFIEQSPKDLETIRESMNSEDWEKVADTAHKIKPSITFMGINSIKKTVVDIQNQARNNNKEGIDLMVKKLEEVTGKAILELKLELEQYGK